MGRTLIAKNKVTEKEIIVCSDVDSIENNFHNVFGIYALSDDEEAYIKEEFGDNEYELDVIEDY